MAVSEQACAKINLSLHIVGRRRDGYHLLDSLVAFADLGDSLEFEPAEKLSLVTRGRFAAVLPGDQDDNLVVRAARWFRGSAGAAITLEKSLPVASGMGGGSADAAAAIRGLARLWNVPVPPAVETKCLGADVPVCIGSVAARVRGAGEAVEAVTCLPPIPVVLVNPGRHVHTSLVFRASDECGALGRQVDSPSRNLNLADTIEWLGRLRNDLEVVASRLEPSIIDVKRALRATGAGLVRMTGSGATCFGIYTDLEAARTARSVIRKEQADWWVRAAIVNGPRS